MKNKLFNVSVKVWVFLGLLLAVCSVLPIFHKGFFPLHDFTHVVRLVEMKKALNDGHIPVRWSKDLGYGYGMPLFSFYGPLPSYLAVLPTYIGFSEIQSVKLLMLAMGIAGWIGMYLYTSRLFGRLGGFLAATSFTFLPYKALDLFVRGAFNEWMAILAVPFVLYGIERMRKGEAWKAATLCISLGLAAIFTSHNLMTMMFLPFVYGYGLVRMIGVKKLRTYAIQFHSAVGIALLLGAFFVIPAFTEKQFTNVDSLTGGYSAYVYHFLYIRQFFTGEWGYGGSILGPEDDVSFAIGNIHVLLAAIGGVALLKNVRKKFAWIIGFFVVVTVVALYMTLVKSQWIWDQVPLLAYMQFPWRFLAIPAIVVPVFAGASVYLVKKKAMRVGFVFICAIVLMFAYAPLFQPREYFDDPDAMYYTDDKRIHEKMSGILPDYIVPGAPANLQAPDARVEVAQGKTFEGLSIVVDRVHEMLVTLRAEGDVTLRFNIFQFPGWTAYIDGVKSPITTDPNSKTLLVQVPSGDHIVSIRLEETPIRMFSNLATVIGILICLGIALYEEKKHTTA